jgi:AraC-like DNA-binding protein
VKKSNAQVNSDLHIIHITGGCGKLFINSEVHALKKGMVLSIPPFVEFHFEIEPGFGMLNIHYRMWTGSGDPLEDLLELPFVFEPNYFSSCEKILNRLKEADALPFPEKLETETLAHELVMKHLASNRLLPAPNRSNDSRMDKIYKMLQSSDCLEYDAQKMAKSCFLSVSQMNRRFKHYFNVPPQKFWEKNRFNNVCRTLRENDKSLSEIADAFAFSDQAYFSKWFKKAAKITPLEYRRKLSGEPGLTV